MKNQFNDEIRIKAYEVENYEDTIISITITGRATIYVPKTFLEKEIKKAMKNKEKIII